MNKAARRLSFSGRYFYRVYSHLNSWWFLVFKILDEYDGATVGLFGYPIKQYFIGPEFDYHQLDCILVLLDFTCNNRIMHSFTGMRNVKFAPPLKRLPFLEIRPQWPRTGCVYEVCIIVYPAYWWPSDHDDVIKWKYFPRYWPSVRGIHRSPVNAPHKGHGVSRSFDVFFDLRLNKGLSKQSWGWWVETPSRPLWRHCNDGYWIDTRLPWGL